MLQQYSLNQNLQQCIIVGLQIHSYFLLIAIELSTSIKNKNWLKYCAVSGTVLHVQHASLRIHSLLFLTSTKLTLLCVDMQIGSYIFRKCLTKSKFVCGSCTGFRNDIISSRHLVFFMTWSAITTYAATMERLLLAWLRAQWDLFVTSLILFFTKPSFNLSTPLSTDWPFHSSHH